MKLKAPIHISKIFELIEFSLPITCDLPIVGFSEVLRSTEGELSFIDSDTYVSKALRSKAHFFLVTRHHDDLRDRIQIVSQNPFSDFNKLCRFFYTKMAFIHQIPTRVGANTFIHESACLGKNVIIGEGCTIHPNVVIHDGTTIGNHVTIWSNTTIGADCFYFKDNEALASIGGVQIDDFVTIGPGCTINRGVSSMTMLGENTKIDASVHIGHGTIIGRGCIIAAQTGIAGKVTIGNFSTLWGQVGVTQRVTIGERVTIGGKSGVTKSLASNTTYMGNPAIPADEYLRERALMRKNLRS
ncbi:MAG: hypothetical protein A2X86_15995 [Bdellovibrionales bacterium GWA2_49_15]|nr:MAG: hypothetical protein A2X86_15995 [Bdellovibrionales bacterium GWA2_49_15]HAZ13186.1 UDP-3-O-(3-hydroxymyristoyl)glucosamine N-acyltransferase [Bdellovibrionales bacterium]